MQQGFRMAGGQREFPWKALLGATLFALGLLIAPLWAQDDNGAASPPPNYGAPAQDDGNGAAAANAPDDSASFQTFYDTLGSQGTWIQSSDYGYVWQPQVSDPDWAPYADGHWVYTDDGWTWVSDEPWGWATYHYGRWVNLDGTGWCWVPGYTWAPAWVSWRYGDGYCGWAPLPPDSFVGVDYFGDGFAIGIGFHIGGDCDGFYGIGAGCYHFLPVNCMGYRNYHGYYHNRNDNFALINRTTNVTNINVTRNGGATAGAGGFHRVTTGGPLLAQVNAVAQTPVERVNLVRTNQPGGGGAVTGHSLALYAPQVNPGGSAQPSRVARSIGRVAINRGTDITRPLAVNSRLTPYPATEAQVQEARIAQNHAPAGAKVITDSASVKPVLQAPLTSLKPVAAEVAPTRTFNTAPNAVYNLERTPSTAGVTPTTRTYPQTGQQEGSPSRVYSPSTVYPSGASSYPPRSTTTGTGGGSESHDYARPSVPAYSPPATSRPSAGGFSGGGEAGRSPSSGGEAGRSPSSGGGGEGSRSGGGSNGGGYQQGPGH